MKLHILLILLILLMSFNVFGSMIPENDLIIPTTHQKSSNTNEKMFNKLIDKVTTPYKKIILEHYGAKEFNVFKEWDNGKVNAAARKVDNKFEMIVYGGLARHPLMTSDALMLVICHELGHLIGGAPTYKPRNISSSEGQADYFATSKCFKQVTQFDDHKKYISKKRIDPTAKYFCDNQYTNQSQIDQCYRSSLAQLSLGKLLTQLTGSTNEPAFDTPDPLKRGLILFNGYPSLQCRIDTLFAGSLCRKKSSTLLDMNLYNKGNCIQAEDEIGIRPQCWYVPREDKPII